MGGSSHEVTLPLVRPAQRTISHDNGKTWEMSAERRLTVQEAWSDNRSDEGYESGHSYSGNFAVKPGFITFGTAAVERDVLEAAGQLVTGYEYSDSEGDPLARKTTIYCGWREQGYFGAFCSSGKVERTVEATLPDGSKVPAKVKTDCEQCGGTGQRPMTDEEQGREDARIALAKTAAKAFGVDNLRRAGQQYGDKWGEAVALVGKDHVWFGGVCSS